MINKAIILCGGTGSRMFPVTKSINKQTLPLFGKPMFFYPLSLLMLCGIKNFLFVNVDKLYSETLDPEIYDSMVKYLGLENLYAQAQIVHKKWYQLHRQAEDDFLNYVTDLYGNPNNATH